MQLVFNMAHAVFPGAVRGRANGRYFSSIYKTARLFQSKALLLYVDRSAAAADLKTATTGRGWIRWADWPCTDLHW